VIGYDAKPVKVTTKSNTNIEKHHHANNVHLHKLYVCLTTTGIRPKLYERTIYLRKIASWHKDVM